MYRGVSKYLQPSPHPLPFHRKSITYEYHPIANQQQCKLSSLDSDGNCPIHILCKSSDSISLEKLRLALTQASTWDLELRNKSGLTPLMVSAFHGNSSAASQLANGGVYLEARTDTGHTALRLAASHGRSECVDILLGAGAKLKALTDNGYSVLHLAASKGRKVCATLLLEAGANLEARKDDEETP